MIGLLNDQMFSNLKDDYRKKQKFTLRESSTADHQAVLFSRKILAVRSGNELYRLVRDSSGFIFIYSEQRKTHLSTDEQVSFSTRQTATHPVKRSPTAELGCFASRSGLVLNILFVAINLSCGALASYSAACCSAGPPM